MIFDSPEQLVPVVVQDNLTLEVLLHGYINEASFQASVNTKCVIIYQKGKKKPVKTGLRYQLLQTQVANDQSFILFSVVDIDREPAGNNAQTDHLPYHENFIFQLAGIINRRYNNPEEGSYVNILKKSGLNKIAQKVGEEAVETVIAALNDTEEEFIGETADLIFHLLVLLQEKNVSLKMISNKLIQRHHEHQR